MEDISSTVVGLMNEDIGSTVVALMNGVKWNIIVEFCSYRCRIPSFECDKLGLNEISL